jgi:hypothetical protein
LTNVNYSHFCCQDGAVFSVELTLDEATDRAVRLDWQRLDEAGVRSAGRNPSFSNRPHLTMAVRDAVDPAAFSGAADALPLTIEFGGMLLFGHGPRFVVARQVVVTERLLDLHRRIAEVAGPPEPRYANTAPDRWTPHVTLARRLDANEVPIALRAVEPALASGEASGLRVWDAAAKTVTTFR